MQKLELSDWWRSSLGQYVLAKEQLYFDQVVVNIFGYYAVQLELPQVDLLRTNRMPKQIHAGLSTGVGLRCDPAQLPLESNSVDLLLLPHVLDFNVHPHQVLREAERVLMPEGRLIIAGFNPISLWGLERRWQRRQGYPWSGNFLSLPRIKDWLTLLGFEVEAGKLACYVPPTHQPQWLRRFGFMEDAGDRWWPVGGGIYLLQAVKRVRGMTMIMPAWNSVSAAPKLAVTAEKSVISCLEKRQKTE